MKPDKPYTYAGYAILAGANHHKWECEVEDEDYKDVEVSGKFNIGNAEIDELTELFTKALASVPNLPKLQLKMPIDLCFVYKAYGPGLLLIDIPLEGIPLPDAGRSGSSSSSSSHYLFDDVQVDRDTIVDLIYRISGIDFTPVIEKYAGEVGTDSLKWYLRCHYCKWTCDTYKLGIVMNLPWMGWVYDILEQANPEKCELNADVGVDFEDYEVYID